MHARHTSAFHAAAPRWTVLPYVVAALACWLFDHAAGAMGRRRRVG